MKLAQPEEEVVNKDVTPGETEDREKDKDKDKDRDNGQAFSTILTLASFLG